MQRLFQALASRCAYYCNIFGAWRESRFMARHDRIKETKPIRWSFYLHHRNAFHLLVLGRVESAGEQSLNQYTVQEKYRYYPFPFHLLFLVPLLFDPFYTINFFQSTNSRQLVSPPLFPLLPFPTSIFGAPTLLLFYPLNSAHPIKEKPTPITVSFSPTRLEDQQLLKRIEVL